MVLYSRTDMLTELTAMLTAMLTAASVQFL